MNDCASESFSSQETSCNPEPCHGVLVNRVSEYVPADNGSSTDQISGINSLSTNCYSCSSFSPKAYKSLPLSAASAANAVWEFTESDFCVTTALAMTLSSHFRMASFVAMIFFLCNDT